MKTCSNCNAPLQEIDRFCPSCGLPVPQAAAQPQPTAPVEQAAQSVPVQNIPPQSVYTPPVQAAPFVAQSPYVPVQPARKTNGGLLAWSIICIVLGAFISLPTCILGIVATVKTCGAAKAPTLYEEQAMLKTAKTLNITATIIGAVMLLFTVFLFTVLSGIFFAVLEEATYY